MAKAVLCPVCQGGGKYYIPPPSGSTSVAGSTSAVGTYEKCHGCGGRGWVEVTEERLPFVMRWGKEGGEEP